MLERTPQRWRGEDGDLRHRLREKTVAEQIKASIVKPSSSQRTRASAVPPNSFCKGRGAEDEPQRGSAGAGPPGGNSPSPGPDRPRVIAIARRTTARNEQASKAAFYVRGQESPLRHGEQQGRAGRGGGFFSVIESARHPVTRGTASTGVTRPIPGRRGGTPLPAPRHPPGPHTHGHACSHTHGCSPSERSRSERAASDGGTGSAEPRGARGWGGGSPTRHRRRRQRGRERQRRRRRRPPPLPARAGGGRPVRGKFPPRGGPCPGEGGGRDAERAAGRRGEPRRGAPARADPPRAAAPGGPRTPPLPRRHHHVVDNEVGRGQGARALPPPRLLAAVAVIRPAAAATAAARRRHVAALPRPPPALSVQGGRGAGPPRRSRRRRHLGGGQGALRSRWLARLAAPGAGEEREGAGGRRRRPCSGSVPCVPAAPGLRGAMAGARRAGLGSVNRGGWRVPGEFGFMRGAGPCPPGGERPFRSLLKTGWKCPSAGPLAQEEIGLLFP